MHPVLVMCNFIGRLVRVAISLSNLATIKAIAMKCWLLISCSYFGEALRRSTQATTRQSRRQVQEHAQKSELRGFKNAKKD